ncbi:MAG: hypothetical protein R2681_01980 [Pyrinomonadaceae bacterium]
MKKESFLLTEKYQRMTVRYQRRTILKKMCQECCEDLEWLTIDEAAELFKKDAKSIFENLIRLRKSYQSKG